MNNQPNQPNQPTQHNEHGRTLQDRHLTIIHSDAYAGWAFNASHPTQGRRFTNAYELTLAHAELDNVHVTRIESNLIADASLLQLVHTSDYINKVAGTGECDEWDGSRPDLGQLALRMAGGTILALETLLRGETLTVMHFAGAKHHAQRDQSSGFCVLADFALAATLATRDTRPTGTTLPGSNETPLRVAILDIDAHHGDGTENLTRDNDRILTLSVHDRSIFPGTGQRDEPQSRVYNNPLEPGSGDTELAAAVIRFTTLCAEFQPDVIMIACGADGLDGDNLSTLTYTIAGLESAVAHVRREYPATPMLLGGAGGYRPDDLTPRAWARMAIAATAARTAGPVASAGQAPSRDVAQTSDEVEDQEARHGE